MKKIRQFEKFFHIKLNNASIQEKSRVITDKRNRLYEDKEAINNEISFLQENMTNENYDQIECLQKKSDEILKELVKLQKLSNIF